MPAKKKPAANSPGSKESSSLDQISASVVVCERILVEKDEVVSAIRILDVLFVPKGTTGDIVAQAYLLFLLKAPAGTTSQHDIFFEVVNPKGEVDALPSP